MFTTRRWLLVGLGLSVIALVGVLSLTATRHLAVSRGAVLLLSAGVLGAMFVLARFLLRTEHRRRGERLAGAIVRHLPNGRVAVVDRRLRYVFADGQGLRDDSPTPAAILGRRIREVYPPEAGVLLEALVQRAFAGIRAEEEVYKTGRVYRFIAAPLGDGGETADRVLLLSQDITELKLAQLELEARNRQLKALSFSDGLLDIANRRAFDHGLELEWRRAARRGDSLALLMVDVDHFKLYNDTYGHPAGDDCLRRVAAILENAVFRPGDQVARFGGEEFAVLLPQSDLEAALTVAARIHARLAEERIVFPESPAGGNLTASIGAAAARPGNGCAPATLIESADAALYRAKWAGRNRTVAAPVAPSTDATTPPRRHRA